MTGGRLVIRADASADFGTGHVIRCRTLATAFIARGWTATLATRDLPGALAPAIDAAGIAVHALDPDGTPHDDVAAVVGIATPGGTDPRPTVILADHYGIDAAWLDAVRPAATVLAVVDDLADRPQPVDLLVNQNLGIDPGTYSRLVPATARVLVGPAYALVRRDFWERRAHARPRDGRIARAIVFISGSDRDDVTARAVAALADVDLPADIVVGAAYPHLAKLRARIAAAPGIRLHVNVDDMAALMDRADLAIGAPSSASWERCTIGLPAILVVLADNQVAAERGLVEAGAATSAGWHAEVTEGTIRDLVLALIADPLRVAAMAAAAAAVTDGHGTERVATEIETLVAARMEAR